MLIGCVSFNMSANRKLRKVYIQRDPHEKKTSAESKLLNFLFKVEQNEEKNIVEESRDNGITHSAMKLHGSTINKRCTQDPKIINRIPTKPNEQNENITLTTQRSRTIITDKKRIIEESSDNGITHTAMNHKLHRSTINKRCKQDPKIIKRIPTKPNEQNENTTLSTQRSYTITERKKIVEESRNNGIKHTAMKYKLHDSTIYKWCTQDLTIHNSIPTKPNEQNENTTLSTQRSYTITERKKIVEESRNNGIKHTAMKYKLHDSTIYKWCTQDLTIHNSIKTELNEQNENNTLSIQRSHTIAERKNIVEESRNHGITYTAMKYKLAT